MADFQISNRFRVFFRILNDSLIQITWAKCYEWGKEKMKNRSRSRDPFLHRLFRCRSMRSTGISVEQSEQSGPFATPKSILKSFLIEENQLKKTELCKLVSKNYIFIYCHYCVSSKTTTRLWYLLPEFLKNRKPQCTRKWILQWTLYLFSVHHE